MVMQTKQKLRKQLQTSRSGIMVENRNILDRAIFDQLICAVSWSDIRWMHCYVPIRSRGEVDTWQLFRYVWEQWPKINIAIPGPMRLNKPTAYAVDAKTTWRETNAAPLPDGDVREVDTLFDLIILPCLGFDATRYRLGYGGGYYDRLLDGQKTAKTIGLAYMAGYVSEGLPHEQHDVALQCIITEDIATIA